jgi:hypothetical protein
MLVMLLRSNSHSRDSTFFSESWSVLRLREVLFLAYSFSRAGGWQVCRSMPLCLLERLLNSSDYFWGYCPSQISPFERCYM